MVVRHGAGAVSSPSLVWWLVVRASRRPSSPRPKGHSVPCPSTPGSARASASVRTRRARGHVAAAGLSGPGPHDRCGAPSSAPLPGARDGAAGTARRLKLWTATTWVGRYRDSETCDAPSGCGWCSVAQTELSARDGTRGSGAARAAGPPGLPSRSSLPGDVMPVRWDRRREWHPPRLSGEWRAATALVVAAVPRRQAAPRQGTRTHPDRRTASGPGDREWR